MLVKIVAQGKRFDEYEEIFKDTQLRFTIIDYEGKVYFDSLQKNEKIMENHSHRKEIISAIKEESGFDIRESKTLGKYYAYYAVKFDNGSDKKYIIRTSEEYTHKREQIQIFAGILIFFFIFLNSVSYFFYINYLKRDLQNKIKLMKNFLESGEIERKLSSGKEERWIYEFWEVLKNWQQNNLDNISKLDSEKKVLDMVISSVDAFVVLLDKNGNIILKNNSLNHLLLLESKKYNESFKYIEIISFIKKGLSSKKDIRQEIYINGIKEYFLVNIKYIKKNDQFLVTIKDITNTRRAVEIQKDFISNVSHELKTPLTNIKGYLIALEDAPKSLRLNFLNIINNNVTKLEGIVIDFLNISKIESSKILQIIPVEKSEIEKQLYDSLEGIINKKGAKINFQWTLLNKDEVINTDKEKLMMILKNIVENGIFYNNKEVPEIFLKIEEGKDRYSFEIKDNGIGIPMDKVKKVFERFYRVDESRTSNLGGTGLGLSIVKELVQQFGGDIKVESVDQEGSVFKFYLLK
ncbi:ATP-binding protein [Fusobacterium sp.]|uniref:sensor histidine kinase n=3 Tax=Fusobacterium sp. TaxID=68766 RepID=UPI0026055F7C|nr:ATP-binding protein [Fusobacterium sp.]